MNLGLATGLRRASLAALTGVGLALAGCASTPEAQEQAQKREEDIATILSEPLDADEYGEAKRCLTPNEYRDIRILDDQRIVFYGARGKLWLNTLRMRCPELRRDSVLRVKTLSAVGRICDLDSFEVRDWFGAPWYRPWGGGMRCTLGTFQPVTESQVDAIRETLKSR
jgi:hypothetical protein